MVRSFAVFLVIVVLLVSCGRESPDCFLSGTVYYEGIAIPVGDVRVKVDQNITYSGSDGSYELPKVRKGIYTLRADKEGFETFQLEREFFEDQIFQNIGMISDELTSSIFGNIYGDYSGEPRMDYRCVLMNPNGTESRLEAVSDSSGYYEITRVPEGYHQIKVLFEKEVIFQDWVEVGLVDLEYDIVFPDVFKFVDERDDREYSALRIGDLNWMTENLAFLPYVDDPAEVSTENKLYYVYAYDGGDVSEAKGTENYDKYGVLYNWRAALNICPDGWRLPDDDDWRNLEKFLGMDESELEMENWRSSGEIGLKLKDSIGWISGEGNNSSWFNALPGGYIGYDGGSFGEGNVASFWTSTRCVDEQVRVRSLNSDQKGVFRSCAYTRYGYSVRCVR